MPKIYFVSEKKTVDVATGRTLPDIVDGCDSAFPFGCRMGSCGTCRCIIEVGMENLNPLTKLEIEMFENFTSVGQDERLGCQLIINGDVRIRA